MKLASIKNSIVLLGFTALILGAVGPAAAEFNIQCPDNADATPGTNLVNGVTPAGLPDDSNVCMHVTAGDGFATEADGKRLYVFGFKDATGKSVADATLNGLLGVNQSAPQIELNQDDNFYLTLSNVGMVVRPDLFDPHTVHYHGFPEASSVFDGVPEQSLSINEQASITYFYNLYEPGTFAWHCHVEATEHMQMGMLGALFVRPKQNKVAVGTVLGTHVHSAGDQYVYNDGDGDTFYDVEKMLLLGGLDGVFHDASEGVQPLPFADMFNNYPTINGRGYPDTTRVGDDPGNPDFDPVLTDFSDWTDFGEQSAGPGGAEPLRNTQPIDSIITANVGDKILLRLVNLDVTRGYTVQLSGGLKMRVVGEDARIYRGRGVASGKNITYESTAIDVDGGTTHEVIVDTTGIAPGTYVLYTTNMNYLSNDQEDFGGMMTTITIN